MARRRKKKNNSRKIWVVLILLCAVSLLGWKIWTSDEVQMRFVYMWPYQGEILEYSGKNKIDPFLVAAVIKNESNFDRNAVSKVGAIGLMQIMPDTGAWIAEQMGIKNFDPQDLYRTDANIRLGCWYLGELEYEFQRNWVLMMIAYNAGRGNTKAWMQENNWGYDFNRIEDIPYSDTREYVRKVLYDRDEYYKLYKNRLKKY